MANEVIRLIIFIVPRRYLQQPSFGATLPAPAPARYTMFFLSSARFFLLLPAPWYHHPPHSWSNFFFVDVTPPEHGCNWVSAAPMSLSVWRHFRLFRWQGAERAQQSLCFTLFTAGCRLLLQCDERLVLPMFKSNFLYIKARVFSRAVQQQATQGDVDSGAKWRKYKICKNLNGKSGAQIVK